MRKTTRLLGAVTVVAVFSIGARHQRSTREMQDPRSMYLCDSILYVSDLDIGIHRYKVSAGAALQRLGTIPLEGNSGVAIRDSIIYANSHGTLLALRLTSDSTCDTAAVIRQVSYDPMPIDDYSGRGGWGCGRAVDYSATPASSGGTGSSYAVFAAIDTFLYYVDGYNIVTMSIAQPASPRLLTTTPVSWDLETLFPTERYLFVGGQSGMYVLERLADPASPTHIGTFQHAQACDPVVVQDTLAFVTLRSGNACGAARDVLLSVSIANPAAPKLLDELPISTPYGLAVADTLLYLAQGHGGLTLCSTARPDSLTVLERRPDIVCKDFIWDGGSLYLMSFWDVSAYDVSDPFEPLAR
jgi:hypothetical protein